MELASEVRLSDYSGGTVWDSHPLPFYPRQSRHHHLGL